MSPLKSKYSKFLEHFDFPCQTMILLWLLLERRLDCPSCGLGFQKYPRIQKQNLLEETSGWWFFWNIDPSVVHCYIFFSSFASTFSRADNLAVFNMDRLYSVKIKVLALVISWGPIKRQWSSIMKYKKRGLEAQLPA